MGRIILSDYGFKKHHFHCESEYRSEDNPSWFWAPEVFDGKREMKSDVWSLGITMIELTERINPYEFDACSRGATVHMFNRSVPSPSSEKWSAECVDFVSRCLVKDVNKRWNVEQLMEVRGLSED